MNTTRNLPVVVRYDSDEDVWVAHCLEGDIISVGDTFDEAVNDLPEAIVIAVTDALEAGVTPLPRNAPKELFDLYAQITSTGDPKKREDVTPDKRCVFATQVHLVFIAVPARRPVPQPRPNVPRPEPIPMMWGARRVGEMEAAF